MSSSEMQNDFMKELFNMQAKGIEMWKENMEKSKDVNTSNSLNFNQFTNPMEVYEKWTSWQKDFSMTPEDNPMSILNKCIKSNQEVFTKFTNSVEGNQVKDVFNKMSESMNSYTNLFSFWQDLQKQVGTEEKAYNSREFVSKWRDKYIKVLSDGVMSEMPSNIADLSKEPMRLFKIYCDYNFNFMEPFNMKLNGDSDKNPFLNKEYMDSYESYISTLREFFDMFREKAVDTMENIVEDYQKMTKEDKVPKTFKDFYNYWFNKNNEVVTDILGTDEFTKLLARLSKESLNYKKNHDAVIEKQLEWMPFTLKRDMRSLYKTLYDLRKEVKDLKKQLNETKKAVK